jgi:hypothetical protein
MARTFMAWQARPVTSARKAAVAAAGVLAAASCGTAAAPGAAGTTSGSSPAHHRSVQLRTAGALCAAPQAVTKVVVFRRAAQSALAAQGGPPVLRVTVASAPQARRLAAVICALPSPPRGIYQCPASILGGFLLSFSTAARQLPAVTIESGGCELVRGAGPTRWAVHNPPLWTVLSRVTRISSPQHSPLLTRGH